jgi:hypothetical protein
VVNSRATFGGLPAYANATAWQARLRTRFSFSGELRSVASVEGGEKWKYQPFPLGHEENISCNNYWTVFFRFFGNDSSGATSTISDQSRTARRWALGHYQHKRENKMKHRCKELGELFNKAQSFGCRVEDRAKNVVIFPPDQTVQPYIAHKSKRAFHEPCNALRHVHERYNTDVTQMIF